MDRDEWQLVQEAFEASRVLDGAQRAHYLSTACAPKLRAEVESLLSVYEADEEFLERRDVEPPPVRAGCYEITRSIGEGGMGAVYEAHRSDGRFRQRVAIKILKHGMGTPGLLQRFRAERQILANLQHRHIAQLLDGGEMPDGRPFLAMEFIDGESITAYCDRNKQPLQRRLGLFLQLCAAVQAAHQSLIVHRDIKPGNILVTAEGECKLLDFGLAEILDPRSHEPAFAATIAAERLLTPEYASPEQIRGEAIGTASDIYSLGALLYELLCGIAPHRFSSRQIDAVARTIETQEIVRPSEVIAGADAQSAAQARGTVPSRLRRSLQGDLDNIVLCSLRKEPARRYASAERFADDIRKHLAGLPVSARPDTLHYRAGKFMSRHRWAVAGSAAAGLAILAALSLALWQARVAARERDQAEQRFNDVRKLARSLIFEINDAVEPLAGSTAARKLIVDRALTYLNSLTAADAGNNLPLERDLASGYERLAYTQGNWLQANLGQTNSAVDSYRRAAKIRESIVAATPSDPQAKLDLSADYSDIALFSGSDEYWRKALQIREELVTRDPTNHRYLHALASSYERDGMARSGRNDLAGAMPSFEKALTLYTRALQAEPNTSHRRGVSYSHKHIASVLAISGNFVGALDHASQALAIDERLCAENPHNAVFRYELTYSYMDIGDILSRRGDLNGALDSYKKALLIRKAIAAADANDARALDGLVSVYYNIGFTLAAKGRSPEAADSLRQSVSIAQKLAALESNPSTNARLALSRGRFQLGKLDLALAADPRVAAMKHAVRLREARYLLQGAREEYETVEARALSSEDRANIASLPEMIARCGQTIAK